MTPKRFWGRLRTDLDVPLRRGAWYRVKKLGPVQVVLDVAGDPVEITRTHLDIVSAPPERWSVVPRPKTPSRFPGVSAYAVCPKCGNRAPLQGRPAVLRCAHCGKVSAVAWNERYFQPPETPDVPGTHP